MAKRALVVIDLQNDYFRDGKWELDGIDAAAENSAHLVASFRDTNDLVIHVRHEFLTNDSPFFLPGSTGAAIHETVRPEKGEPVILKHHINGFQKTNLRETLTQNNIEELVICGAMSHMCVDATTRAAVDLGYPCTLIHDACATRSLEFEGIQIPAQQVHAAHMATLGFGYATVDSTKKYLDS
ncbi:cysteine hydrolase [bacterium AH-315-C08]|nr:cysteine hydrolase [bacterium AH-315-C08]